MSKYSVPDNIRAMRPSGTEVKKINGHYYVYPYTSTTITTINEDGSKSRKTQKKVGKSIGKITEQDGFIPNNSYLSKDVCTVKNFGNYYFAFTATQDIYDSLIKIFHPDDANKIYLNSLIFLVDGFSYMKDIKRIYDTSYLSVVVPSAALGQDSLHDLYFNLGCKQTRVKAFEQAAIENSSKKISIDGHVIACTSENNDLSEYGYKYKKYGTKQVNWMTAYDVVSKRPLLSSVCNGSSPDKVSIKSIFDTYTFKNTLFLVDRGFNSNLDKAYMSENGNTYIVPMISGRNDYSFVCSQMNFDQQRYFVYSKGNHASMIYYSEVSFNTLHCFAYKDTVRAEAERQAYIHALLAKKTGYSEEGLFEEEQRFGLFLLETNDLSKNAREVFEDYKERWAIETYYNYVRNTCDFNSLHQQDYFCMQGVSFIVTVSGMIFQKCKERCSCVGLSLKDVFATMSRLKIVLENSKWYIHNDSKVTRQLADKLDLSIPAYLKS